jgi:hypothetical protein
MRRKSGVSAVCLLSATLSLAVTKPVQSQQPDPKALIEKVVAEAGGVEKLRAMRDVEYVYFYRDGESGKATLSLERYVFDGEKSWARYSLHEGFHDAHPEPVVQGYNGKESWEVVAGVRTTDPQVKKMADFLRKTNFYWFVMTFKLLDPGMTYAYAGQKKVDGTTYELVKVGFNEGVGDAQDSYLLYINPTTWRVDQFLFTVMDFGLSEPLLMKVSYERISGLLLPTKRKYAPANWEGKVTKAVWSEEISTGIRFMNGFPAQLFNPPSQP